MYEELWNAAAAQRTGLAVIMIDVDNFKQINDAYGHLHGDKVLKQIAHFLPNHYGNRQISPLGWVAMNLRLFYPVQMNRLPCTSLTG